MERYAEMAVLAVVLNEQQFRHVEILSELQACISDLPIVFPLVEKMAGIAR
jgi:hypothetical protein